MIENKSLQHFAIFSSNSFWHLYKRLFIPLTYHTKLSPSWFFFQRQHMTIIHFTEILRLQSLQIQWNSNHFQLVTEWYLQGTSHSPALYKCMSAFITSWSPEGLGVFLTFNIWAWYFCRELYMGRYEEHRHHVHNRLCNCNIWTTSCRHFDIAYSDEVILAYRYFMDRKGFSTRRHFACVTMFHRTATCSISKESISLFRILSELEVQYLSKHNMINFFFSFS